MTSSSASSSKMVAPYLTPDRMLEFGGFAAHYEAWRQYEAAKGEDAPSLQETIDPTVLSIWGRRHEIKFTGSTKRLDTETLDQYSLRRRTEAAAAAKLVFAIIAPKGEKGSAEFISRACKWQPVPGASVLLQADMHEVKFEQKLLQLGYEPAPKELIKMYLGCFHSRMQQELSTFGKGNPNDGDAGRAAFTTWTEYANKVHEMAKAIENAEHFRSLFGLKEQKPKESPKVDPKKADSGKKDNPTVRPKKDLSTVQCRKCHQYGHYADKCQAKKDSEPETRGRLTGAVSQPKSTDKGRDLTPVARREFNRAGRGERSPGRLDGWSASMVSEVADELEARLAAKSKAKPDLSSDSE